MSVHDRREDMIEEIVPAIYRIELPMPQEDLQSVNCYLIKGEKRHLVVDSGIDTRECKTALLGALRELDADIEKVDFFITHLHIDHFGLAPIVASAESKIYTNSPDVVEWGVASHWTASGLAHGRKNGFPENDLVEYFQNTPNFFVTLPLEEIRIAVEAYEKQTKPNKGRFQIIDDGEIFNIGDYSLTCLLMPGHSSGHICLYEPRHKLLFAGDHILETITPAIFLWSGEDRNPLQEYIDSLNRTFELEIDMILPGHHPIFRDCRKRISEIKEHHRIREEEIASVLDPGGKSAYAISSKVSWNIPFPWEQFSRELRWMALAETMAHLRYMERKNRVRLESRDNDADLYFPA